MTACVVSLFFVLFISILRKYIQIFSA